MKESEKLTGCGVGKKREQGGDCGSVDQTLVKCTLLQAERSQQPGLTMLWPRGHLQHSIGFLLEARLHHCRQQEVVVE